MMDRCGIEKACTSIPDPLRYDFREGNRMTLEIVRRHPRRLIGFCIADPRRGEECAKELDRYLGGEKFSGVKLHVSHTRLPYDHPLYDVIYAKAREHGVPVLAHTFSRAEAARLLGAARRFPGVPFIVGHSGAYEWADVMDEIAAVPNAYFDVCCSCIDAGRIEAFVAVAGAERVLLGTDMPFLHPAVDLSQVVNAQLEDADKALILGGNMACILGMKG